MAILAGGTSVVVCSIIVAAIIVVLPAVTTSVWVMVALIGRRIALAVWLIGYSTAWHMRLTMYPSGVGFYWVQTQPQPLARARVAPSNSANPILKGWLLIWRRHRADVCVMV